MRVVVALATLAAALAASHADAQRLEPPRLTIPRVTRAPERADFEAMTVADAPLGMRRIEGLVQRFPDDGAPVSERTVVYVGYDTDHLYVVFLCFDSQRDRVGAHLLARDAFPNDEDTVAVHIDTFRDLKHAYGFQVNAYGVQTDGIYTEGQGWDLSWDTVYRSDATLTKDGYVVLFAIPFRSLRFPSTDTQQWGMFFYRAIARRNEQVYWPPCSTRVAARFRQAAIVDGIDHVSPSRNLQAIPYLTTRSFKALDAGAAGGAAFVSKSADAAVGVDAKAVVRDSIVLDATVNPDFSQVESDQPQITVNKPFEVFFPEKRPFFLENASYFNTPIQLLFTRRVADPMVGGRATGRAGPYAIGAMVVDDRTPFDAVGQHQTAWLGVARVMRDLGRESYVGAFVSNRSSFAGDVTDARATEDTSASNQRPATSRPPATSDQRPATSNRIVAADGRVKLGANWFAAGQAALSNTGGLGSAGADGSALFASMVGAGRRFNYELDYNDRSPAFRAVDGFIPRVDVRSIDQTYAFRARPSGRTLTAWGPDLVLNRTWDHSGRPLDFSATPRFELQWPGTTTLDVYYTAARQTLRRRDVHLLAPPAHRRLRDLVRRRRAELVANATGRAAGRADRRRHHDRDDSPVAIADAGRVVSVRSAAGRANRSAGLQQLDRARPSRRAVHARRGAARDRAVRPARGRLVTNAAAAEPQRELRRAVHVPHLTRDGDLRRRER